MTDFTCWCLDGQRGGALLPLSQSTSCAGPVWAHLDYTRPETQRWIRHPENLPDPVVIDTLLAESTRPRTLALEQGLLVTLRGVNLNPGAEPDDMVSLRLWVTPERVISTHLRPLKTIGDVTADIEHGNAPRDAGELLVSICEHLIANMADVIDAIEEDTDEFEHAMLSEDGDAGPADKELATLRSRIITLRRYLAPQRDAMEQILTAHMTWIRKSSAMRLRETINRLTRYVETLDAARDRIRILQEQSMTRLTEQLSRRLYFITLLSAVFLPLSFLTGLFGVNLGGIPGAQGHSGFTLFVAALLLVAVIEIVLFRKARWL